MALRRAHVTFDFDPTEYGESDDEDSTKKVAMAILNAETDWPNEANKFVPGEHGMFIRIENKG